MDYLADTCFLIDLWREQGGAGPATRFARAHADAQVGLCWVAAAEFLSGCELAFRDAGPSAAFLADYPVVHSTDVIVREYARLFADLKTRNALIGPNDLWIAATSLCLDLPVLTRNIGEFKRVAALRLVDYREPSGG